MAECAPLPVEELAGLPREAWLTTEQLARSLGVCKKTVLRWRKRRHLPAPFPFGRGYAWVVGAILDYVKRRQEEAEARMRSIDEAMRAHRESARYC